MIQLVWLTIGLNIFKVFTLSQVVHTKFIVVALTDYSVFKRSSKVIHKQAAAAGFIALISEKKQVKKKRKKKSLCETLASNKKKKSMSSVY